MGNRLRQVSLSEASPEIRKIYQNFFGDRDPVAQPGTATGTPGDYWTTFTLVPDILAAVVKRWLGGWRADLNRESHSPLRSSRRATWARAIGSWS